MKIAKSTALTVLITLFLTTIVSAANVSNISIQNDTFAEKFKYSIGIYAISLVDDFGVGNTTIALRFNDAVLSNPQISGHNTLFHNNDNYEPMSINIDPGGVGATNIIGLVITPKSGVEAGALLHNEDTRLATITFDISSNAEIYRTETTQFEDVIGLSAMASLPNTGQAFLLWDDFVDNSLICIPDISGSADTAAEVGLFYDFTPSTVDVCNTTPDGALEFSITTTPTWASFDTAIGRLSGTPDFTDIGTESGIIITVSDTYGDTVSMGAFDIAVLCPPLPAISGAPTTSILAGTAYDFLPTVNNGCGALTFSITNPPAWTSFDFDTATGQMTGTPTLAEVGITQDVVIEVTDENNDTDSLAAFDIQVTPNCTAPSISGSPSSSVVVGAFYDFIPTASNGCGTLTYSITNAPAWASFNFDTATGRMTGTPTLAEVGITQDVVIEVTDDNSDADSLLAFDIQVTPNCAAPSISGSPGTTVVVGDLYDFTPTVSNGCDLLVYTIVNKPSWAVFDPDTGQLRGRPVASDEGLNSGIVITVTDSLNDADSMLAFDIQVDPFSSGGGGGGGGSSGGCFVQGLQAP